MRNLVFIIMVEHCQRMNENRLSIKILSFFSKTTHVPHAFAHILTQTGKMWKGEQLTRHWCSNTRCRCQGSSTVLRPRHLCLDQNSCRTKRHGPITKLTFTHNFKTWMMLSTRLLSALLFDVPAPSLSTSPPPPFSSLSLLFGCELKVSTHASHEF